MDEDELRAWVQAQIKRPVPDPIWELLRAGGYLNVVDEEEQQDLLRRTNFVLQLFASQPMKTTRGNMRRRSEVALKPMLTSAERQRNDVLSAYYGKVAGAMPEVRRFREETL